MIIKEIIGHSLMLFSVLISLAIMYFSDKKLLGSS